MKRITFVVGHYGSGKTEFALNLAIQKKIDYLLDLDIVNPFFRSRELESFLDAHQIKMIASTPLNGNYGDLPFLSKDIFLPFQKSDKLAVFDMGGNDAGALILRQFRDYIEENVDVLMVVNIFREQTQTVDAIIRQIKAIEGSSGMKITGLVNNSHLLKYTTVEDIIRGNEIVCQVSEKLKLPILYTVVRADLLHPEMILSGETLAITLYLRKTWL